MKLIREKSAHKFYTTSEWMLDTFNLTLLSLGAQIDLLSKSQ